MWIIPKNLTMSASVRDTVELISDYTEQSQICEQSLIVRSKVLLWQTWLPKWKRDSWTVHLSGRILKPSRGKSFVTAYTSSLEVIRANHFQQRENGSARTIRDTFGRLYERESRQQDLFSASSRTWKDTFRSASERYSKALDAWVMQLRSEYSQRLNAEHHTSASEFSYWPTATVAEGGKIGCQANYGQKALSNHPAIVGTPKRPKGNKSGRPDPVKTNTDGNRRESWQTPEARNQMETTIGFHGTKILKLGSQVEAWATPNARDWKGKPGVNANQRDSSLPTNVGEDVKTVGKLNPRWVETLMGLPVGWTMPSCVCPVIPELTSLECVETELCHQPRKKRLAYSVQS